MTVACVPISERLDAACVPCHVCTHLEYCSANLPRISAVCQGDLQTDLTDLTAHAQETCKHEQIVQRQGESFCSCSPQYSSNGAKHHRIEKNAGAKEKTRAHGATAWTHMLEHKTILHAAANQRTIKEPGYREVLEQGLPERDCPSCSAGSNKLELPGGCLAKARSLHQPCNRQTFPTSPQRKRSSVVVFALEVNLQAMLLPALPVIA